jgi:peptidoglycan-associated lipoprotein
MKHISFIKVLLLSLVLTVGGAGCKSPKKPLTPIPGSKPAITNPGGGPGTAGTMTPPGAGLTGTDRTPRATDSNIKPSETGIPAPSDREMFEGRQVDAETFKSDTIYFDFDRSSLRQSETPKLQTVADYLKQHDKDDLLIEGHCDERGTPEYNRALGERRALSAREFLVNLGISAGRIRTISYGEDKSAVEGHDEAAWSKNRRCEFKRLLPKAE